MESVEELMDVEEELLQLAKFEEWVEENAVQIGVRIVSIVSILVAIVLG